MGTAVAKTLDPMRRSSAAAEFEDALRRKVVGQDQAIEKVVEIYQMFLAGLNPPGRPVGNLLFLGPTGSGKTRVVEAMAQALFGDMRACIKIDCAEFQHSHEIAKLIGSPPGYLGHRETHPVLTQEALAKFQKEGMPLSVVLFDEIEKASDALWQLLLGILDKATLTLGDNRVVNFEKVLIIMTSNLGAKDMHAKRYGFKGTEDIEVLDDAKNEAVAKETAKKHFTPEFMNRLDHVVVFNTLTKPQVANIMMIELGLIQQMMLEKAKFIYQLTPAAKFR